MPNLRQYTEPFCINIYSTLQTVYHVQLVTTYRPLMMPCVSRQIFYNKLKEFENVLVNINLTNIT